MLYVFHAASALRVYIISAFYEQLSKKLCLMLVNIFILSCSLQTRTSSVLSLVCVVD